MASVQIRVSIPVHADLTDIAAERREAIGIEPTMSEVVAMLVSAWKASRYLEGADET
jgi:hypothetical protein